MVEYVIMCRGGALLGNFFGGNSGPLHAVLHALESKLHHILVGGRGIIMSSLNR